MGLSPLRPLGCSAPVAARPPSSGAAASRRPGARPPAPAGMLDRAPGWAGAPERTGPGREPRGRTSRSSTASAGGGRPTGGTTMTDDLAGLDAHAQAELARRGDARPIELVDAAIARVEKLNPELNAVIHERFDRARAEAAGELPDGPFRGVPMVMKDLDGVTAGD